MHALRLHCGKQTFLSCCERGLVFVVVYQLIVVVFLLRGAQALGTGFSSCGPRLSCSVNVEYSRTRDQTHYQANSYPLYHHREVQEMSNS